MLGLPSVPSVPTKDVYCLESDAYANNKRNQKQSMEKQGITDNIDYDGLWVSWESVKIAANKQQKSHKERHGHNTEILV